jgi:5'-3' exonuclease
MDFMNMQGADHSKNTNLMIVDGLNLAFRYKHAGKKIFAAEYINTIKSLANSYGARNVIILGDGGSSYREAIYPEYKANRKELREKQTEKEAQDFKEFLDEFTKAFNLLQESFYTFRFMGVEADDIAAYLTKILYNDYEHIWLISSDKDWDLLINDKVSRFSYVTRKEITLDNWDLHYTYKPKHHISIKVLMGDKGDNVPGVEGVGIKRAEMLINEYGDGYDIYSSIPINSKYKYIQNLNSFADNLLLNYQLMDLLSYCEEALGDDNIEIIKEELEYE